MPRCVPFLLLLALAGSAVARPLEPPRPNEKWLTLRVDEFTLVSNVSPAETSAIARDLLRMRHAIGEVTNLNVRSPKPTSIFIFGTERAFAPYREAVIGQKSETVRGAYTRSDGGNFIVMICESDCEVDRTIDHELTHYFVRNTTSALPLWLSEGIAEYYSTFRTSGDAVHIGRSIPEHVQWLRQQTLIPLRELFATTADSLLYDEGSRSGVFYAQSWALFHYLMADDGRRAQLSRYLRNLGEDQPADNAFAAAFGKTYSDLEQEVRAYVRRTAFTYTRYTLPPATLPEIPKPVPMPRDALLFELGHLLAHAAPDSAADARRFLDEVVAADASHAGAHADIGRLQFLAGRREEANESFARAVALGSSDPQVYLLVGISALNAVTGTNAEPGPPGELRLRARKAFERSAELDPEAAVAWTGIGATYISTDEDPAPGVAALERALALAPGDADAAFYLVQLYARSGRRAEAQELIDTVLSRGAEPEQLAFAREALRRAGVNANIQVVNEAIARANAGKTAEALAILDGLLPQIEDAEMLSTVKKLRADLARPRG
ncbi:MAG TPA: tetratricopeptide repeat protein [Thermoanaerobaculia bacterium]|nr:tetratricopeptide repeat protein [Thermoanaerobaculia bacterium]